VGLGLTGSRFNVSSIGSCGGLKPSLVLWASFGALKLKPLLLGHTKSASDKVKGPLVAHVNRMSRPRVKPTPKWRVKSRDEFLLTWG
jgi:hypothetical protein